MADVRPFLANVLRGRPAPPERIEAVVHHYELMGGRSPLTELTMRQADGLRDHLRRDGLVLPVYLGMRNWHPYLDDTLTKMAKAGVRRAAGVILSAQQNDAGWYRYRRDAEEAQARLGGIAPEIIFADEWHAHPGFIAAMTARVDAALHKIDAGRRSQVRLIFTAHSIPTAMADTSPYVAQLEEAATLIAAGAGHTNWSLAFQSRSGNPRDSWLEPDICAALRTLATEGGADVVVAPLGFVCDHVEVLFDLDIEARQVAAECGLNFVRAETVNDHPAFIGMLADVVRRTAAKVTA